MSKSLLANTLAADAYWTVNKKISKKVGLVAALLLADLISKYSYFARAGQLQPDGAFFNTAENIEIDLGIGKEARISAQKALVKAGFLKVVMKGLPRKNFYYIQDAAILKALSAPESRLLAVGKADDLQYGKRPINKNKGNKNKLNNNKPKALDSKENPESKPRQDKASSRITPGEAMTQVEAIKLYSSDLLSEPNLPGEIRVQLVAVTSLAQVALKAKPDDFRVTQALNKIERQLNVLRQGTMLSFDETDVDGFYQLADELELISVPA